MLGLQKLGIEDPHGKDRKRLVTFVEIDRCATDAVAVVTGCRLGKRALKFRDWGKVAATFVDCLSRWFVLQKLHQGIPSGPSWLIAWELRSFLVRICGAENCA